MDKYSKELYITLTFALQGQMNLMSNSIEIFIEQFFNKIGKKSPLSFKQKINGFNKLIDSVTTTYNFDIEKLKEDLIEFDNLWNITKHGKTVGNCDKITFIYKNEIHVFDSDRIKNIRENFTEIQKRLLTVLSSR